MGFFCHHFKSNHMGMLPLGIQSKGKGGEKLVMYGCSSPSRTDIYLVLNSACVLSCCPHSYNPALVGKRGQRLTPKSSLSLPTINLQPPLNGLLQCSTWASSLMQVFGTSCSFDMSLMKRTLERGKVSEGIPMPL